MMLHSKLLSYMPLWSRHYIAIVAMACLCALLGWPSYAVGTESLIIAGAAYDEPGDNNKPAFDAGITTADPVTEPVANLTVRPTAATTKTTTTAVAKTSSSKSATATSSTLPKTEGNDWIAVAMTLLLLGPTLLNTVHGY